MLPGRHVPGERWPKLPSSILAAHLWEELVCLRQGTVLRTQTPVLGSVFSTMTKGLSSSVATVRWRLSATGCRKEP